MTLLVSACAADLCCPVVMADADGENTNAVHIDLDDSVTPASEYFGVATASL